jgi:hypothetical protein
VSGPIPCPICTRRLCDHSPEERHQTHDEMMGGVPTQKRPHFVSESCEGVKCCAIKDFKSSPVKYCGKPAKHKLGEEMMHDDPNPNRHNLTQYVCCEDYVRVVGLAALVYSGCDLSREDDQVSGG